MIIEVEVDTLEQLDDALPAGPDIVLLDNMSLDQLRAAVAARRRGSRIELEASGGVNLRTVRGIAETGVERISVGALTHSAAVWMSRWIGVPEMTDPSSKTEEVIQRLRKQYNELAELAGSLAHEIKNPLSVIRMNMELLAEDFADAQTPQERRALTKIETVQKQCTRLENLLRDFLKFARLRDLELSPGSLNEVVDRVLNFFETQAKQSDIEFIRFLDPGAAQHQAGRADPARRPAEPGQEQPGGDARRRPVVGPHALDPPRGGPGPDRHRLRHGQQDRDADVRSVLFHQERRLGAGPADRPQDHRGPRGPDQRAKRSRPRDPVHHRIPAAGPNPLSTVRFLGPHYNCPEHSFGATGSANEREKAKSRETRLANHGTGILIGKALRGA